MAVATVVRDDRIVPVAVDDDRRARVPLDKTERSHQEREWRLLIRFRYFWIDAGVDEKLVFGLMSQPIAIELMQRDDTASRQSQSASCDAATTTAPASSPVRSVAVMTNTRSIAVDNASTSNLWRRILQRAMRGL